MLEIEKMENKKLKTFQKLLQWITQSLLCNQSKQKRKIYEETDQELGISENT